MFSSHDVRLFSAPPDALNAGWDAELHSFELTRAAEAAVCGPLAAAALRLAARSTGIRVSNRGGAWHSRPAFLRHCESGGGDAATRAAARLAREAVLRAGAAAAGCGAPPPLTHAWANVASGGAGHHGLHDHDGALLSGVLYLSVPAPPGGCSATGGELLLRTATSAPADAAGAAAGSWCEFAGVTPLRGLLLLFPGWLPHAVLPMPAAAPGSERVSLSFNLGRVG